MKAVLLLVGFFLTIIPVLVPFDGLHWLQQIGLVLVFLVGISITVTGVAHILEDASKRPKEQK